MLKLASPCLQLAQLPPPNQTRKSTGTVDLASTKPSTSRDIVDRLSRMPTSLIGYSTEWLPIPDSCQLMQTSRFVHEIVRQFYARRLNSQPPGFGNQMFWYYLPSMRLDHYVPTDQLGLDYLNNKGIYYPLTEKIRKKVLTIEQALGYIDSRRRMIQASLDGSELTRPQKISLRNSLFREHILSGRCSVRAAINMARDERNLFYLMTLQHLFRFGQLDLQDLAHISRYGLQLLHDPLSARLFAKGLIGKQQVLSLTETGLTSILICLPGLQCKKLGIEEVLALTEEQIADLRETGLAEQVHTSRIELAAALQQIFILVQSTPVKDNVTTSALSSAGMAYPEIATVRSKSTSRIETIDLLDLPLVRSPGLTTLTSPEALILLLQGTGKSLRQVILSESAEYRIRWIKTFGMIIHHLPIDNLIRFLDTSSDASQSVFGDLDDGLNETEVADLALAYIQLYIDLAQHVSSADYLRVALPFITDIFGFIAWEAFIYDHPIVLTQCCEFWSRVKSSCAITGNCGDLFRELARPLFEDNMQGGSLEYLSEIGIAVFGELLHLMDLHLDGALFKVWPAEWTAENWRDREDGQEVELDFFRALLSPFEKSNPDIGLFFAELDP